jgi:hypothetical protein
MNESSGVSASSLATTPSNAQPNMMLTEREYLDQQMDEARQAMSRTSKLLGKNLGHSVDPRLWTKSHPWLSLSAAAIASFAVISIIPHRKKPPAPPAEAEGEPAKHGLFHALLGHGFKTGWRTLASVVISKIIANMNQDEQTQEPPADSAETAPQPADNTAE